jgi:hypothetical protein
VKAYIRLRRICGTTLGSGDRRVDPSDPVRDRRDDRGIDVAGLLVVQRRRRPAAVEEEVVGVGELDDRHSRPTAQPG